MARRRSRSLGLRGREIVIDRMMLSIGVAALLLAGMIVLPFLYPAAKRGPTCSDLAHPIGGNNRSLLAQVNNPQGMDLKLEIIDDKIGLDEPLKIRLTFINEDIGPITLYLPSGDPPVVGAPPDENDNLPGIRFVVERLGGNVLSPPPAIIASAPDTFDRETLYQLGSRGRCNEQFTFINQTLDGLGINEPGEYRIRAYYQNFHAGSMPPTNAFMTPTATPAYTDQGVWVGRAASGEAHFTVLEPTQPPSLTPPPTLAPG